MLFRVIHKGSKIYIGDGDYYTTPRHLDTVEITDHKLAKALRRSVTMTEIKVEIKPPEKKGKSK